jgi:uncharacterized membrane protein
VVYAVYSLTRFSQYLVSGYDLGIFDQAVRAYSRFRAPLVSLKGEHYNILGDHFHPIIATLAPLYWIWNDPRTLLLAQAVLVASSAIPFWTFARRRFERTPSAMALVAYLLCWPLQGLIDFDFHEVAFAIPLLAWLIEGLDRRSDTMVVISSVLLLGVKEDMGSVVMAAAVVLLVRRRYAFGAAILALGAVGFWLATSVVIPAFSSTGRFAYWTYDSLGPNAAAAVRTIVEHPVTVIRTMFSPAVKTTTMVWVLAPTFFLSLGSVYAVLLLPLFAERFLSSREVLWGTEFHYSAVLAPILFMAALDTLGRIVRHVNRDRVVALAVTGAMMAVAVVGTAVWEPKFPFQRLITGNAWDQDDRMQALSALLPLVPPGTCVGVDDRVAPQLTAHDGVVIAGLNDHNAAWIVLDLSQTETTLNGPDPKQYVTTLPARGYQLVAQRGPIQVWHNPSIEPGPC